MRGGVDEGPGLIPIPNVEIYLELFMLQQQPKYPIVSVSCTLAVVIFENFVR